MVCMGSKVETIQCPVLTCDHIYRSAGKIERLQYMYDHVKDSHPMDIPKGGYTLYCPIKGCLFKTASYSRERNDFEFRRHLTAKH